MPERFHIPGLLRFTRSCGILLLGALSVLFVSSCDTIRREVREIQREAEKIDVKPPVWSPPAGESVHLALGNPSNAGTIDRDNYLIVGDGHVLSYNNSRGTANWASWRTTRVDLGERLERPDFRADPRLPPGFRKIEYFHYSGSGFDRGHLVPSADRFANPRLNEETFFMTNIVPQTGALNQYPWERLESYARTLARSGRNVYNVAGCYGDQGRLRKRVMVPTNCWKVVIAAKSDVDANATVIAVDMPNTKGIENDTWQKYRTTIREIERRTGYDLLSNLPPAIQEALETKQGTE
ncbi:MAG: DNA/RNA non-specific endonuclease [Pyrinomonadaceae bacterium]|nr:DNA/RNA non-specific endonuclease [Pyrinomonadaceae bacterium]